MGLLEYEEMSFLLDYANESDVFVDCGANIGIYSLLLGPICARGIAIEPSEDTFCILQHNLHINQLGNVTAYKIGVGNKRGELYFTKDLDCENHLVEEGSTLDCEKIEVDTLDAICQNEKQTVNILKIDVEGHEKEVLQGAVGLFQNPALNVVIMEIFGNSALIEFMKNQGFNLYIYDPKTKELSVCKNVKEKNNGIFIRDIELTRQRITGAKLCI